MTDRLEFYVRYRVQMTEAQRDAFATYVLDRADDLDTPEQQREARILSIGYHVSRACTGENIDAAIDLVSEASESAYNDKDTRAMRSLDALHGKLCKARRKVAA